MNRNHELKTKWEKYCMNRRQAYENKINELSREALKIQSGIRFSLARHEYTDVEIKEEQLEIIQKHLDDCQSMSYEKYVLKAFEKEFRKISRGCELTDQDRVFFRIYYYREYQGMRTKDILLKLGIDHNCYYRVYHAGIERFFYEEDQEEQSKVG